jgi:sugar O-acyltransferase (sialic acid O-acetyltransferase NeuD family)
MSQVFVIGAGGHAKVVVALLRACGETIGGAYDDDRAKIGSSILGVPVLGSLEDVGGRGHTRAVMAIGGNRARHDISSQLAGVEWVSLVHPHAMVHESATIGAGTVVFAGAIVQPDASLGSHCILNTSASVDHDSVIGDYVHIAPGAHLGGSGKSGDGALIGIGSTVAPGVRVGSWAVLGAGAVAVRDVSEGSVAVGVPATQRHTVRS